MKKYREMLKAQKVEESQAREAHLAAVKNSLRPMVVYAEDELPKIEAASAEYRAYVQAEFAGVEPGKLSRVREICHAVESLSKNPSVLKQAIKEVNSLSVNDTWGRRVDGSLDVNAAANIKGSLAPRLQVARGCAPAIRDRLKRLKAAVSDFEQREETLHVGGTFRPVSITQPRPDDGSGPLRTTTRFDPRL